MSVLRSVDSTSSLRAAILHIRVVYQQIEQRFGGIKAAPHGAVQILPQRQHHRRYASNPHRDGTRVDFEMRALRAAELGEDAHVVAEHLIVQLTREAVNRPQVVHDLHNNRGEAARWR